MTERRNDIAPRQAPHSSHRIETRFAAGLFILLALVPLVASDYVVYILPQYAIYGLLAMSLGLLWGFVGIVSFGQAAFFALGAYAFGLTMSAPLPFNAAYAGLLIAVVSGGLLAAATGYFLFSSGVKATYFVLITLALSIIGEQIAVSQSQITGGYNGMFVARMSLGLHEGGAPATDHSLYFVVLVVVAALYFLLHWLTRSPFGKVLAGIRGNEDRLTALGFEVRYYKTAAFALSGALAGLAGALYATDAGFVSPSLAGVLFSTEVVVWVAIGGRSSLLGAFVGALIVASLSNYLSAIMPDYWQLLLGLLFIVVVMFFKNGLAGSALTIGRLARRGL